MTKCLLSEEEIRKLTRDLQILIATNGTLTRVLGIVANDEIVVEIIKQEIHDIAPRTPELVQSLNGRVLQRQIILRGRISGTSFVAAESFIAIDLLPPEIKTRLTMTNCPIGEVLATSCLETFKEDPEVWIGKLPNWLISAGYENPPPEAVTRRYRIITEGRPVLIITEHFLLDVVRDCA